MVALVLNLIRCCSQVLQKAILEFLKVSGRCDENMAMFMLVRSIQSLQIHGSDEVALGPLLLLVFHVYYSLVSNISLFPFRMFKTPSRSTVLLFEKTTECRFQREGCENLVRVLQQVPECNYEEVDAYDKRIMTMRQNKEVVYDKCKREMTKKLLRPIIAVFSFAFKQDLSQQKYYLVSIVVPDF